MFGVCLQSTTSATAVWTPDTTGTAGRCEPNDGDPWRAVPASSSSVARTAPGVTGTVELVWGLRPGATTPAGRYAAGVSVEVIAPAA